MKRTSEIFVSVCFLAVLAVGMAAAVLREPQVSSFWENRRLADYPEYTSQSAGDGSYASRLEEYLDDHAPLRTTLLEWKVRLDLALGRPVVNDVVVTPDRLLPYLPPERLEERAWIDDWAQSMGDNLKRISDAAAEYGGYYCYVAVPCQYAYFEADYPWYLDNYSQLTRLTVDELARALDERGVAFLDAGAAFEEQGSPARYGSRVDNHFSMEGAFALYRLVLEKAAAESGLSFPILGPEDVAFETLPNDYLGSRERKLLNVETREERLSVLRPLEGVPFTRTDNGWPVEPSVYQLPASEEELVTYNLYMGGDVAQTVVDTGREELPSVLIYGDSFTNALECVLYLSFDEMHALDLRHYHDMSLEDYIRAVRPDVVICIRDYEVLLYQGENGGGS